MTFATRHAFTGTRKKYVTGASAVSLMVALSLTTPALAQTAATPTSPQCTIVDDVVTCTGVLTDGFTTTTRDVYRTFRFRSLASAITARNPNGVAINVINDLAPITIDVDAPGLTITSQGANFARPPFVVGSSMAAGILAQTRGNISITSNTNISVDANTVDLGRVNLVAGIAAVTVQRGNEVRDVRIRNDGNITTSANLSTLFALDLAAIWVGYSSTANIQPSPEQTRGGLVDILNTGRIDSASHNGIAVRDYFGGSIKIVNTGTIIQRSANRKASFHQAISVDDTLDTTEVTLTNHGQITLLPSALNGGSILEGMYVGKSIGGANSKAVTVVNNGSIIQLDQDTSQLSNGIRIWPNLPTPVGGTNFTNDPNYTFTAINNGTINTTYDGIEVAASVNRIITNNGSITVTGKNNFALGVSFNVISSGAFRPYNPLLSITRFSNSATGSIIVRGQDTTTDERNFVTGVNIVAGSPVFANAGRIEVAGLNSRGVSMGTGFQNFSVPTPQSIAIIGEANISNVGTISAAGSNSVGLEVRRYIYESRDVFNTRITNSGTISATGTNALGIAIRTQAADPANPGVALFGQSDIVLDAASVVSGGSGTGAAIIYEGGLMHRLTNEGQISAASGNAIIGGSAREIIVNRGQINGRVPLGDNDDSFTLFATGNLPSLDGGAGNDALILDGLAGETGTLTIGPSNPITNIETFTKRGGGFWTVRGTPSTAFPTRFDVEAGQLAITGDFRNQSARVLSGATLAGVGQEATRLGSVTIEDGATLSPGGMSIGTLDIAALTLSNGSILRFDLGQAGRIGGADNDLINIAGNLTLDGQLQVVATPDFGNGVYRLFNYGGTLTDNGLTVWALPGGAQGQVQTSQANQVNLIVGSAIQFWDGANNSANNAVNGGSGVWSFNNRNWTTMSGDANAIWGESFAVFQGTPGTVRIDNAAGNISATGLQFAVDGYRIEGETLILLAPATIRVGDATAAGASYTATIASVIAGNDVGIVKTDLGTLVLSGINTFTVGTSINAGTISISDDRNLGDPTAVVTFNGGALRVTAPISTAREWRVAAGGGTFDAGANAFTHSGTFVGSGTLSSIGTGSLTLSGNSSAFAGRFALDAGRLNLAGQLGGTLLVGRGATLTGTGTAGNLDIAGTVSPGNSAGLLTATGDVTFRAGSIYNVELLANGTGDRINAVGRALIEGGTVAVTANDPARDYTDGSFYRILNATGGRTGTFAGITGSSAFLDFTLRYDATGADVRVEVIRQFPDVARTFNQINAANGLRDLDKTPQTDAFDVYRTILFLDEDPARTAFDNVSGEIYAVALASAYSTSITNIDRFATRAITGTREGWTPWGGITGQKERVKSDGNGARYASSLTGGELGIDYRGPANRWAVGIGGGLLTGDIKLTARASDASSESWNVGGFGRFGTGGAGFSAIASASYSQSDYDIRRRIDIGDLARTAKTQSSAKASGARLEARYGLSAGDWSYGPIATVRFSKANLGGFVETGADSLNLSANANRHDGNTVSYGGFIVLQDTKGSLDMSLQYSDSNDDPAEVTLALAGSPTRFQERAAQSGGGTTTARISGDYNLGGGWSIGGNLRAAYGDKARAIAGSASVAYRF
jgi:autotransporter-associated beta strand protein